MTIGIVLAVLGMGGTLVSLYLLSLLVSLLKRLFPVEPPAPTEAKVGETSSG
jgi:hypothetical protein